MNAVSPVETLVTDHLDLWTTALNRKSTAGRGSSSKVELYGIKKLRELILELAVRGLLVPQDPNDEPASELLKRIAVEKTRLVREGKIKKEKHLPAIGKGEEPFVLPNGWAFFRLSQVAAIRGGCTPSMAKSVFWGGDIPWVSPKDMHDGLITNSELKVTANALTETSLELVPVGSVLIVGRSGILKRKLPAQITGVPCTINQDLKALTPVTPMFDRYLQLVLLGNQNSILKLDVKQGTTVQSLVYESLFNRPFSLPPLAEQHRIVAKVDELMALCDQLEQETEGSLGAHQTLVETLLNALTSAADYAQFASAWQRIAGHFDTLFTTEESIAQLKQTILQLAVMGKLVPQDPNDEPARTLLKRIHTEKTRLIAEGKIKKDKPPLPISEDEKSFELPPNWLWVKPEEFSIKITDGEHFRPPIEESGVYFLSAKDVREEGVSFDDPLFISDETARKALQRCNPEYGDLLIVSRGATVGRMCKVNTHEKFCLLGSVILVKPTTLILSDYLAISLKSPSSFSKLINASGSTAQPAIYLKDLKRIAFPLPPIEEQHRIVAKVDELMALCDQLKSRLSDAQTTQLHLADALVEQAIG